MSTDLVHSDPLINEGLGALSASVSGYLGGSSITSGLLYGGTGAVGTDVEGEIAGS